MDSFCGIEGLCINSLHYSFVFNQLILNDKLKDGYKSVFFFNSGQSGLFTVLYVEMYRNYLIYIWLSIKETSIYFCYIILRTNFPAWQSFSHTHVQKCGPIFKLIARSHSLNLAINFKLQDTMAWTLKVAHPHKGGIPMRHLKPCARHLT